MESKRVIFIPKGSTNYIISYLNKNNFGLNFIDTIFIKFIGYPQNGWIDLQDTKMTKYDFLYKICTSKAALRNVTLIPGETYHFFLEEIAQKLQIDFEELLKVYHQNRYKLDGNILSQTYSLPIGMRPQEVIKYLFDYTEEEYIKYSNKIFGKYEKENWYKYIIIASIIQKESANKEEMPIVSSVIYNRLEKNMALQMDGTLNYGIYSHTAITSKMIREDESSYNTYKNKGIPSDPVCAVEFDSIKSAIFPKKTSYLYFVKAPNKDKHIFTSQYKLHKIHVNKYKRALKKAKKAKKIEIAQKPIKVHKREKKLHNETVKPKTTPSKSLKDLWKNVKTN